MLSIIGCGTSRHYTTRTHIADAGGTAHPKAACLCFAQASGGRRLVPHRIATTHQSANLMGGFLGGRIAKRATKASPSLNLLKDSA